MYQEEIQNMILSQINLGANRLGWNEYLMTHQQYRLLGVKQRYLYKMYHAK